MERRGRKVKGKKRDREREPAEEWGSIMAFKGRKVKGKKKGRARARNEDEDSKKRNDEMDDRGET